MKISVIIPTYNREKILGRAIESIMNQTVLPDEIIIVDDCSTDSTYKLKELYTAPIFKWIFLKKNGGPSNARNIGIQEAMGEYISFLDSDDTWEPCFLEKQLRFLNETNSDVVMCSMKRIGFGEVKIIPNCETVIGATKDQVFERKIPVSTQLLMGKKFVFQEYKFDTDCVFAEDWELLIRISEKYKFSYQHEVLVNVYTGGNSITLNTEKCEAGLDYIIKKHYSYLLNHKKLYAQCYNSLASYKKKNDKKVTGIYWDIFRKTFNIKYLVKVLLSICS